MATRVPYVSSWPPAIVLSTLAGLSLKIQRGGNEVNVATPAVLNIADLLTRVDNDRELVTELFSIFKTVYTTHLHLLSEAVTNEIPAKVEAESHRLKGMLLNLSATRAAAIAHNLETMGRERKTARHGRSPYRISKRN